MNSYVKFAVVVWVSAAMAACETASDSDSFEAQSAVTSPDCSNRGSGASSGAAKPNWVCRQTDIGLCRCMPTYIPDRWLDGDNDGVFCQPGIGVKLSLGVGEERPRTLPYGTISRYNLAYKTWGGFRDITQEECPSPCPQ